MGPHEGLEGFQIGAVGEEELQAALAVAVEELQAGHLLPAGGLLDHGHAAAKGGGTDFGTGLQAEPVVGAGVALQLGRGPGGGHAHGAAPGAGEHEVQLPQAPEEARPAPVQMHGLDQAALGVARMGGAEGAQVEGAPGEAVGDAVFRG